MKYLIGAIIAFLVFLAGYMVGQNDRGSCPEYKEPKTEAIKEEIVEKGKEVEELKEHKNGISYTTKFSGFKPKKDSIGKVDTIKVDCDSLANDIYDNLLKCDTANQISTKIIANQDTIIADQKKVITIVESDNSALKKDLKKQKRRNAITKIVAVVVIVCSIVLVR